MGEAQAEKDEATAAREQQLDRLVEGGSGWFAGWQMEEARRRSADARLLRKSFESDINLIELQLLQGDPTLAFIRDLLRRTRSDPEPPQSVWLKEQFETGALPRDPELVRTLICEARRDPKRVERLVAQAKDSQGRDVYTRFLNDASKFS